MPFRELSIMDQREELAKLALAPGANKAELFRRFGVSRSNGYKWMKRYAVEGRAGLSDRSRRPHRSPGRTEANVETQVLEIRAASNGAWAAVRSPGSCAGMDPSRFRQPVRSRRSFVGMASWSRCGRTSRAVPAVRASRAERTVADGFQGHFAVARGRCHPLTVIDDHSRYALAVEACGNEQDMTVRERLTTVFRRYGLPLVMLMDNGPPWGDSGAQPFTSLRCG